MASTRGTGLQGRIEIITGAGRGLGQTMAELFAGQCAKVDIADLDAAAGEAVAATLRKQGSEALHVNADFALAPEAESVVARTVAELEQVDILVNNAGIQVEKTGPETSEEEWDRILAVNLTGALICPKCAIIDIRKRGKVSIVCISSLYRIRLEPQPGIGQRIQARPERIGQVRGTPWTGYG